MGNTETNKDTFSIRNSSKWDTNPFVEKTVEAVVEHTVKQKRFALGNKQNKAAIVNVGSGEIVGETALFSYKTVDNESFAKVFTKSISKWAGMTKATSFVFEYILKELKPDKDSVYLYEGDFIEKYPSMSKNAFYRGIGWLLSNDFVAKSKKPNIYFINPTLFFNGDRLALVEVWESEDAMKKRIQKHKEILSEQKQTALDFGDSATDIPSNDF